MKKVIKSIFQYVGAILLAIVIAALLRFFIVDFYSIPGRRTPGNCADTGIFFPKT